MALILSLAGRLVLISSLSLQHIVAYLIAAHVLCRWTTLPLSYFLPAARAQNADHVDGQGARIARLTTLTALITGTVISFGIVVFILRAQALAPILASIAVTFFSALFYKRKIGGITGDCFGATNQISEIAVYLLRERG